MKSMELSEDQWDDIHDKLTHRYQNRPSVLLIRTTMKEELGFTVRRHQKWSDQFGPKDVILVDFYSAEAATMFRMTYL